MTTLFAWLGPANAPHRLVYMRRHVPLLRQLAASGVRPIVALIGDSGGLRRDVEECGIAVEVVPLRPPPAAGVRTLPLAVHALRSMIARHRPDIVDASDPLPALAAALAARATLRRPRPVVMYRRHFYAGPLRTRVWSQLAARFADRMIVSSEAMRDRVEATEWKSRRFIDIAASGIVEPPAIGADDIAAARLSLGIGAGAFVIGAVSYLYRHKGIDVLIRAMDHLRSHEDLHLVIAGSGPEETALREISKRSRHPVHFLGHRDDVHLWMSASDVMVMPSRAECLGRVTLEAMSVGRPLIASRVGGLQEAVVDGETGFLVPVGDSAALAAAIDTLVRDAARARTMGAAARARFEAGYTIAHMAASSRDTWERAVGARRRTAMAAS